MYHPFDLVSSANNLSDSEWIKLVHTNRNPKFVTNHPSITYKILIQFSKDKAWSKMKITHTIYLTLTFYLANKNTTNWLQSLEIEMQTNRGPVYFDVDIECLWQPHSIKSQFNQGKTFSQARNTTCNLQPSTNRHDMIFHKQYLFW